jgi:hypothetical protein
MALPRKKVREARRAAAVDRIENRQERKQHRSDKRIENIDKGESLGFKLSGSIAKAADGFAGMIGGGASPVVQDDAYASQALAMAKSNGIDPKIAIGVAVAAAALWLAKSGRL